MNREHLGIRLVSIIIMLFWGTTLIYFHTSGRLHYYLPADGAFRPMALWGGIGMCIIALFNLLTLGSPEPGCEHHHSGHDHDQHGRCLHDHDHDRDHGERDGTVTAREGGSHAHGALESSGALGRLVALTILTLPLGWAALFTPDQFSIAALENKGLYLPPTPSASGTLSPAQEARLTKFNSTPLRPSKQRSYGAYSLADLQSDIPRNDRGDFLMEVTELFYSGGDTEVADVLEGQPIETIARVIAEKVRNPARTRLRIFRLSVMCCIADARPCSIAIEFDKPAPKIVPMTWVKVRGTLHYEEHDGALLPLLRVSEFTEAAEPEGKIRF